MKQELVDRLLAAAQAVVGDVEVIDEEFCQVDTQVMDVLVKVVKAISDDAVRELTESLRQSNARHTLVMLKRDMDGLFDEHYVKNGCRERIMWCDCWAALMYKRKVEQRDRLKDSLGKAVDHA